MDYDVLKSSLSNSLTVKLLKARNTALIVSFLHQEFKARNRLTVPQYELVNRLSDYLEYLEDEALLEADLSNYLAQAKRYIDIWCDEDHRYLRRYPNEEGEPVIELTSHTEKAFQWVESLEKQEFVGTESRFRSIYQQLEEIIDNTLEDPPKKIKELEDKRRELTRQINQIKKTGRVSTFNDTQIKERYYNLSRSARELLSEFKEVEQNFREISQNIYKKQTLQRSDKGQILAYTLDATDALKSSDQGRSFYAFWEFLVADNKQEELRDLLDQLYAILEERQVSDLDPFLKNIKFHLHYAGRKVLESNHLIAEKLSRTLAERNLAERRRVRELINAIKNQAVQQLGHWEGRRHFIELETHPEVAMPLARPLGEPEQTATFAEQPEQLDDESLKSVDLSILFDQFEMNRRELEANIRQLLKYREEVSLQSVLEVFPIQKGLAELIAYLSIASAHRKHRIDPDHKTIVSWRETDRRKQVMMPEVTYVRTFEEWNK